MHPGAAQAVPRLDAAAAEHGDAPAAVALRGVSAGYGGQTVLSDLTLDVRQGELAGVVGPSGCGKTTLLRLLTGGVEVHGGRAEVLGRRLRNGRIPARIGYVPQVGSFDRDFPLRVREAVLVGLAADSGRTAWYSRHERAHAGALLERLGLGGLERQHVRELSGGQQQRLLLARAMVRRCDVLLLDEPTSGVDLATRGDVLRLLASLNAEGLTVLLTTHDLNWVAAHLPRVVCLNRTVIADGTPAEVFTAGVLRRTYGTEVRVLRDGDALVVTDAQPLLGGTAGTAQPVPLRPGRAPGRDGHAVPLVAP